MITGPRKLRVEPGDVVRAEQHNGLVQLAESLTFARGRMKGTQLTDGFIPRIRLETHSSVSHPWAVAVEEGDEPGELLLTISPGFVGGIVPKIGELALDEQDEDGQPPKLKVSGDAWAKHGAGERALLMLRYDLDASFAVIKATPLAVPTKPTPEPRAWHKLLGFLSRLDADVRYLPMCFFNQYFDAAGGKTPGAFRAYPRAAG